MSLKVRALLASCMSLTLLSACSGMKKREVVDKPFEGEAMREASKTEIQENEVSSEDVEKNLERRTKRLRRNPHGRKRVRRCVDQIF